MSTKSIREIIADCSPDNYGEAVLLKLCTAIADEMESIRCDIDKLKKKEGCGCLLDRKVRGW